MPYKRPTPSEILQRVEVELNVVSPNGDSRLRQSVEAVFAKMIAMASHELNGFLDYISKQILPDTAEAENLNRHGGIWGVLRKSQTAATGSVQFTGANGSTVPQGSILRRADNIEYTLANDVTITAGTGNGIVTAVTLGASANAVPGTKLTLISPVSGVQSEAVVSGDGLTLGVDPESDNPYLGRILSRIQNPPHGGASHDYESWAMEVPGVTRAWAYPKQYGRGTVGLTFVMDDKAGTIIPSPTEVSVVQNHIEIARPSTADLTVFAPAPVNVDFEIHLNPNALAIQNAIKAEIADLFRREAKPGGILYISRIREAISVAAGEYDHVLIAPAANVVMDFGEIPVVGNYTWGGL